MVLPVYFSIFENKNKVEQENKNYQNKNRDKTVR